MKKYFDDLLLISDYGRSGQGWLSYMLCYILNARYIEPYALLKGIPYSNNTTVLKYSSGSLPNRKPTKYSMVIKTHEYPDNCFNIYNKVVFLTRDPRDVAVSAFNRYSQMYRLDKKSLTLKSRIHLFLHHFKILSIIFTAIKWKKHYQLWMMRKTHHVKYEDLLSDPTTVINSILEYIDIKNIDPVIIRDSINIFNFQSLTGRKPGDLDNTNLEFRSGTKGNYKKVFNIYEKYLFSVICGSTAKKAGYNL